LLYQILKTWSLLLKLLLYLDFFLVGKSLDVLNPLQQLWVFSEHLPRLAPSEGPCVINKVAILLGLYIFQGNHIDIFLILIEDHLDFLSEVEILKLQFLEQLALALLGEVDGLELGLVELQKVEEVLFLFREFG
jgi:hypothetical protein